MTFRDISLEEFTLELLSVVELLTQPLIITAVVSVEIIRFMIVLVPDLCLVYKILLCLTLN